MDNQFDVILLLDLPDELVRDIEAVDPRVKVHRFTKDQDPGNLLETAGAIFGWPPVEWLARAKSLKILHLPSAGADRYTDPNSYASPDVVVTNSSGVFGIPISEHIMGMCLDFARGLSHFVRNQEQHKWERRSLGELYGKTMGIVGLGDIGLETAKRAKAFGMRIIATKRIESPKPEVVDQLLFGEDGLKTVMKESDYIVVALPATPQTKGIISREMLSLCKPSAYIVNVGRGSLIDEAALIEFLQEGRIAGAGLDVFATEPLPPDSLLWDLENVLITPHNAGSTPEHGRRTTAIFTDNLRRLFTGQQLRNVVDLKLGY